MKKMQKVFCVTLVIVLAMLALALGTSAQEPQGAVKGLVPPRPDLMSQMQMASMAGRQSVSLSADMSAVDASAVYAAYLQAKMGAKDDGGVTLLDLPAPSMPNVNSRVLVALVNYSDVSNNNIPQPSTENNTDWWVPDFSGAHYQTLLFSTANVWSLRSYYREASYWGKPNALDLQGDVHNWTTLTQTAAYYGADPVDGVDTNVLDLVRHAANTMALWTPAGGWAAYDQNSDGYIDNFFVVHAGKGQEAGGGALGDDAVWSGHGSLGGYAFTSTEGIPDIDNFVIVPEDAPVGLFVHEMGRLFGLPATWNPVSGTGVSDISWPKQDAGGSGEASPAFWDVMGQGFWLGRPLGTKPASMNAWARMQMGWLTPVTWDLSMMPASIHLDQLETTSADNQALKIDLPERVYVEPHSGSYMRQAPDPADFSSPSVLSHTFDLTATTSAYLRFWTTYDLEPGYDHAYVQVDDSGWADLAEYNGSSGGWVQRTVSLNAYVGQTIDLRFYLDRDDSIEGLGWFLDDFELLQDGVVTWTDDVELSDAGPDQGDENTWDAIRFPRREAYTSAHYYLVEWRNDDAGFDQGLREAYNMTNLATGKAEYFGYNPGLLIWYVNPIYWRVDPFLIDNQDADNNVLWHPGEGFLLAVDAHPDALLMLHNGLPWRTRVQMLDATFRYNPANPQTYATVLKDVGGVSNTLGPLPEVRYFWDAMGVNPYWRAAAPDNSAKTPMYGVRLEVEGENANKLGATVRFSIDAADMSQSTKEVDLATAVPGDTLQYTIVLRNTGIADAHTIVVEDMAPAGTSYVSSSYTVDGSPSWAITETNGIRWQGTVPLANPVTITFQVVIDSIIEPGIIENVAHVYEGTVPEIDLFAETYVESLPCLTSSVKTSDPTMQLAGGLITYTIQLENTGTAQANATITDCIPVCTTYVQGSLYYPTGSGYYDPQTNCIYWSGPVPAGENGHSPYIQFVVKINPGQIPCTLISNQVMINDGIHPPFGIGANTTVLTGPNLWESSKTVNKAVAAPGEELLYTLSLYNGGNQSATGVSMVDNLPANITYVPGSLTTSAGSGAYDAGLNRVTWSGNLAVLGSAQLTFRATIASPLANGTWITNTATITQGSNTFVRQAGTEVLSEPRLTNSTKTVESDAIGYGGTLTYTITLINDGTQDATVLLTDTVPAGTEYKIGSLSFTPGYSAAAIASPWRIQGSGTVAAGHSVTVTFAVSITLTGTGIITNTATIHDGMHPPFDVVAVTYVSGLSLVPPTTTIYCGDELIIPVRVDNVNDLQGFQVDVDFDPAVLRVLSIQEGTWFSPAAWTIKSYNNISGTSTVAATLLSQPVGKSGGGVLYNLRFRTIGSGTTPITITFSQLSNTPAPGFTEIPHNVTSPVSVTIEDRSVTGYALMQGRTDHSGVTILLNGVDYGYTTAADGSYAFCPPTGNGTSFTVKIMKNGYLYGQKTITVPTSGTITLSNLTLLGGDPIGPQITATRPATCPVTSTLTVAGPPDGKVNILDLTFVGARFGKASTDSDWGPDVCNPDYLAYRADINEDNIVNIFDLVLVGNNFGAIAPSLWP